MGDTLAIVGKLALNDSKVFYRVAVVERRYVQQVQQHSSSSQMLKKLYAQTGAVCGTLNQPRNIGDDKALVFTQAHDTKIRHQRCERVVGDLRASRRDDTDQGRFPCIRQAEQTHISDQAQLQAQITNFPWLPLGSLSGRTVGAGLESRVTQTVEPGLRHQHDLISATDISQVFTRIIVKDTGTQGHAQIDIFAFSAFSV